MKLIALLFLALSLTAQARDTRPADGQCEWRNPGSDKYMLPLDAAVDRLAVVPADVREKLKARLRDPRKHVAADDHVLVTRTGAQGVAGDYSLWDMNGGQGGVCWGAVTTKTWSDTHAERALVFCEDGYCVAYFSVCRNIARAILVKPAPPPAQRAQMPLILAGLDAERETLDMPLDVPSFQVLQQPDAPAWPTWRTTWQPLPQYPSASSPGGLPGVSVTPIPEPETWSLLAIGLVILGIAVGRGRILR